MDIDSLSRRGARAAGTPLRIDYDAFLEAEEDLYHPASNPTGKIPLNIAENRLSWHELRERIREITSQGEIPDWVPGYTSTRGAPEFRASMASFLSRHLTKSDVDPDHLVVSSGATGVIEMTALVLADAGDVAVIPAPCYPVYERDIGNVAGVERYDLVTEGGDGGPADGTAVTVASLERARREIEAGGRRFRMLIVTTPNNPTGAITPLERLEELADWCIQEEIHLVVNEIYGLSVIDTEHPDLRGAYEDDVRFASFATVMDRKASDYLHLWYSLSKDLGISGLRVGLAYSRNEAFLQAYANLNLTHTVSNHTQWVLGELLSDTAFMEGYVARNQRRLTEAYAVVARSLDGMGIPYVPSR
ncbi:MAG: aminotransferase class I/II-fold pyridoxal phosphate-dependent enzyme, partial [Longimicrobiales bacterium]|nr:aminotransferase class I/II-fold pyridoxal phosphate-dependent enzyme [Longimicrobiales bacterium]